MSKKILIPDIGADEVSVTEIFVKVGDTIAAEQSVITVEGDKASMEVPAPEGGVIAEILVKEGDMVKSGDPLYTLAESGAAAPEPKVEVSAPVVAPVAAEVSYDVPDIGSDEVTVTEILVKVGDMVKADQNIMTIEGDKASMDIPSPSDGVIKEIKFKQGDLIKTGLPMLVLTTTASAPAPQVVVEAPKPEQAPVAAAPAPVAAPTADKVASSSSFVHASPAVRRVAREFGVNLDQVKASGPKNRILKTDVQSYVKQAIQAPKAVAAGGGMDVLPWPKVDFTKFGAVEEIELTKIKKISGANLHRNWAMIPHVTQWDKADITDLESFRKSENERLAKRKSELKFTPLVFILKGVAKALEDFPNFRSSLSMDKSRLIVKQYINIGVAVDTPNGLVVPVIKDVDKKSITELSQELGVLSKKAREGKLTGGDMQGGCFTISSLGGIGGTHFTPIINAPEVAILGVSKSAFEPIWNGKEFTPRLMLPLSLSYDHRVIDGAEGARFSTYLKDILTDIRKVIL